MTTAIDSDGLHALRRSALAATLAPSVHNTQPWRFVITAHALEIHADRSRQLAVLDPTGRQLLISCGCALLNARVALASAGYAVQVDRLPDEDQPDLLARLRLTAETDDRSDLAALEPLIALRRTNRRRFGEGTVAAEEVDAWATIAAREGALLVPIVRDEHRLATAMLSQEADREQNADPAYRAELRAWTTDDPHRRDGVPAVAVPHVDAGADDDIPIRDFDTRGSGGLPVETKSSLDQCLLLVCSYQDDEMSWLRAGEALEHVLLDVARHGYAASPLTQVVEVASARQALRQRLGLQAYPDVLLRVGRAAGTVAPARRLMSEVLTERHDDRGRS